MKARPSKLVNYTTTVAPERSVDQITKLLSDAGASSISRSIDESREISALSFTFDNQHTFRLVANISGVLLALKAIPKLPNSKKTAKHAASVAWRIQKQVVEIALAQVACGMVTMDEAFISSLVLPTGSTLAVAVVQAKTANKLISFSQQSERA